MAGEALTGGCLCGAVRYRAEGVPLWVAHCHCNSCRRQTGTAFATFAGVTRAAFRYTQGAPATHASSQGVTRSFCAVCGSPLTYEGERWPDEVHIHVGTLDDPGVLAPQAHVHTSEQLPWLHLADKLPRFAKTASGG